MAYLVGWRERLANWISDGAYARLAQGFSEQQALIDQKNEQLATATSEITEAWHTIDRLRATIEALDRDQGANIYERVLKQIAATPGENGSNGSLRRVIRLAKKAITTGNLTRGR